MFYFYQIAIDTDWLAMLHLRSYLNIIVVVIDCLFRAKSQVSETKL